jgi:hypothetical protein
MSHCVWLNGILSVLDYPMLPQEFEQACDHRGELYFMCHFHMGAFLSLSGENITTKRLTIIHLIQVNRVGCLESPQTEIKVLISVTSSKMCDAIPGSLG